MKLLVIETKTKSSNKREHNYLQEIFKKELNIDLEIDYISDRNITKKVEVENGSIVQSSIPFKGEYDWVHVRLSNMEWRKLKLRSNLYGEHQKVNDVSVTFGRWTQKTRYKRVHLIKHEFPNMTEHVMGMLHEFIHGQERSMAIAHSYLYGYDKLYTKAQEKQFKPKRYVKESSMKKALQWVFKMNKAQKYYLSTVAKLTPKKQQGYKYFSEAEAYKMNHEFMLLLDKAREIAGIPFAITSGYRTPEHNAKVGGVPDSAHTKGLAVDLRARNGNEIYTIVNALMEVGIKRIGINWTKKFVHADISYDKPNPTIWTY